MFVTLKLNNNSAAHAEQINKAAHYGNVFYRNIVFVLLVFTQQKGPVCLSAIGCSGSTPLLINRVLSWCPELKSENGDWSDPFNSKKRILIVFALSEINRYISVPTPHSKSTCCIKYLTLKKYKLQLRNTVMGNTWSLQLSDVKCW